MLPAAEPVQRGAGIDAAARVDRPAPSPYQHIQRAGRAAGSAARPHAGSTADVSDRGSQLSQSSGRAASSAEQRQPASDAAASEMSSADPSTPTGRSGSVPRRRPAIKLDKYALLGCEVAASQDRVR